MVSGQLETTWDRALRDVAGGGLVVRVFAEPGGDPRIQAVMTARDPKIAGSGQRDLPEHGPPGRQEQEEARTRSGRPTTRARSSTGWVAKGRRDLAYAIVSGTAGDRDTRRRIWSESSIDCTRMTAVPPGRAAKDPAVRDDGSLVLRGHVDLQRLRTLDPKKYTLRAKPDTGLVFLVGSWYEALKQARAIDAVGAMVGDGVHGGRRSAASEGCASGEHQGIPAGAGGGDRAAAPAAGHDRLAEPLARLGHHLGIAGGAVHAGGGPGIRPARHARRPVLRRREFGADVLGSFDPHWRLVVAQQDYAAMKPAPDQKLPAFAIVAELNGVAGGLRRATEDRLPVVRRPVQRRRRAEEGRRPRARIGGVRRGPDLDHEVCGRRLGRRPRRSRAPSVTITALRRPRSAATSSSAPAPASLARWFES